MYNQGRWRKRVFLHQWNEDVTIVNKTNFISMLNFQGKTWPTRDGWLQGLGQSWGRWLFLIVTWRGAIGYGHVWIDTIAFEKTWRSPVEPAFSSHCIKRPLLYFCPFKINSSLLIPSDTCYERSAAIYGLFLLKFWVVTQFKFNCTWKFMDNCWIGIHAKRTGHTWKLYRIWN